MGIIPVRGPFKHDESINFELKHLCTFYTYVFHLAFCIISLPVYSVLCVVDNNLQWPVTILNSAQSLDVRRKVVGLVLLTFCTSKRIPRCWERADTGSQSVGHTPHRNSVAEAWNKACTCHLEAGQDENLLNLLQAFAPLKPIPENAGGVTVMPLLDHPDGFMVASCH